jgi:hypothetical protein
MRDVDARGFPPLKECRDPLPFRTPSVCPLLLLGSATTTPLLDALLTIIITMAIETHIA